MACCAGIIKEARTLLGWQPKAIIKIPMTKDGLKAISVLSKEGVKINTTLIFSANQV